MDDPSLLLMLSNLLHLHTYLDDSSVFLPDSASPPSAASLHSSAAAPLLFFAIASVLSYASSSLCHSHSTSDADQQSPSPPRPPPPMLPRPPRSLRSPLSSSFFLSSDHILSMDPAARDARFRSLYGVSHPIFDTLLKNLRRLNAAGYLAPSGLPLEHALAVALARLARGASARSLARSLDLPPAVVARATHALTRLLATRLYRRYVILPLATDHLLSTIQSFKDLTALPNVAGALASSPVRLKRRRRLSLNDGSLRGGVGESLREDDEDLLRSPNRGYPSILLQAVADHRKVFWDACVRAPGSSDPASHLRDSRLYHSLLSSEKDGGLLHDPVISVRGHQVHPYLIGDSSYPLLPCLLTPFSPGLSPSFSSVAAATPQEAFDAALGKGRSASVEAALALLKGRWKILRNLNVGLDHAAQTVVACVVLHNMCQFAKEPEDERRYMWRDPPERPQLAKPVESEQPLCHLGESLRMALAEELFERQQKLSGTR